MNGGLMMRLCQWSPCDHWAQWRVIFPGEEKMTQVLCGLHKDQIVTMNPPTEAGALKVSFVGAVPVGA